MARRATSRSRGKAGSSPGRARIRSLRQTKHTASSPGSAVKENAGSKPAGVFMRRTDERTLQRGMRSSLPILAQEAFVLPDDGQFDELRSAVVRRREAHREPADVVIANLLHRIDELLAREIVAGAAQSFDQ